MSTQQIQVQRAVQQQPSHSSWLPFCQLLPKVELHAHLNGCVRSSTISLPHLAGSLCVPAGHRSLADCFVLFDAVHQLTTKHDTITRITREVVEDFAAEHTTYLELRTTPKDRPEHGISKRSYAAAVLAGLQQFRQAQPAADIAVKLLLSIDRRNDTAAAMDTVEVAVELMPAGVVGVDLSGNPCVGRWATWLPALQRARQAGLKVTLHAAEVCNYEETHAMLDFGPDRLCHMCVLDGALQQRLWASNIPVELCLTSNVKTNSVPGFVDHHFGQFYAANHPVVLCTDDSGVFATTLSQEYAITAAAFGLDQQQLIELASRAVEYCFCSEQDKQLLRHKSRDVVMGMTVLL
ncbi:adenosine/AMP deaminase family protein [Scenedesmus sp. NREL 46B-D3]|nr:adenosine/AMP deaminase family protein [Scenedesmus sp. NREL 46B-D3]